MVEIGRLAIKIAGRDAGRECLVIDSLKDNLVMIDGNTRRRKCSLKHLELQPAVAKIKKGAEHKEVLKAMESLGIGILRRPEPKFQKKETKTKLKVPKKIKLFGKKKPEPKEKKLAQKTSKAKKVAAKPKTEAKVKTEKASKKK